jgi:hypothetical protein
MPRSSRLQLNRKGSGVGCGTQKQIRKILYLQIPSSIALSPSLHWARLQTSCTAKARADSFVRADVARIGDLLPAIQALPTTATTVWQSNFRGVTLKCDRSHCGAAKWMLLCCAWCPRERDSSPDFREDCRLASRQQKMIARRAHALVEPLIVWGPATKSWAVTSPTEVNAVMQSAASSQEGVWKILATSSLTTPLAMG